jgi:cyclophilin family peptidyl-prolyl cis-trans isomerase
MSERKPAAKGPPIGDERILLRTSRGDLVVGLYDTIAPKHATQLRKLVRLGVYDTTWIHRVEPGFVAQITNAQNRKKALTPEQHKAITPITAELSKLQHRAGVVSMAHDTDDVNSAETSFSFMLGRAAELDRKFTIIGEVEFGMPLLKMLEKEPRDYYNRPKNPVVVDKAEIKTGAEIAKMKAGGELKEAKPPGP